MHRYRVSVTAQLTPMSSVHASRIRSLTGASVKELGVDIVRIELTTHGRDAGCAADRALLGIERALSPTMRFVRPPVWVARQVGPIGRWRRTAGRWPIAGGDDDGLGGVREPRRPRPSTDSAAAAVELPAA